MNDMTELEPVEFCLDTTDTSEVVENKVLGDVGSLRDVSDDFNLCLLGIIPMYDVNQGWGKNNCRNDG